METKVSIVTVKQIVPFLSVRRQIMVTLVINFLPTKAFYRFNIAEQKLENSWT
jgi:hypothetical protein